MPVAPAGRAAVNMLLDWLDSDGADAPQVTLETQIIVRGTTTPPSS
jgi:DNA-binding LacI/PurR family transcriptional regulator